MGGARDARRATGHRHTVVFVLATAPAAASEAEVAPATAGSGHCEGGGLVDQDPDPSLRRLIEAILKAIEDRRCQEEEAAAAVAGCLPSWLAALEIITRPSLILPLAVITTVAVDLSQGWLKLEPVNLGEIVKDIYGRRRK
ncbi:hypothetical protein ACP4OV_023829 [Aristida adscensionis]